MNLIWKEYIQFLGDNGVELPIEEGYYWLDRQIIKACDKEGELHKLFKIQIADDLSITYKRYDFKPFKMESWLDTVVRNKSRLDRLEEQSIALLQKYGLNTNRTIIDTNSTGKDSMVKTCLAKKAGLKFKTYFNVTTVDTAESNRMAKRNGFEFAYPKKELRGFYNWSKRQNLIPSRLNRACCKYFKERPTIDNFDPNAKLLFLFGMRNSESNSRSQYGDIWINKKWGKRRDWIGILPIRQWTDADIWLYILREGLEINKKYKMGYSRCGCNIVCPNYTKSVWVLDKYWYPLQYERWQERLRQDFISNNKWIVVNYR